LTTGQTWFADTFMFQRAVDIHAPLLDRHECGLHVIMRLIGMRFLQDLTI